MQNAIPVLLLVVFLAHLVAFTVVGLKRREWYYLGLITTFGLLSAAFGTLLFAPDARVGQLPLHRALRYAAWAAAALSISWTAVRKIRKTRR